MRAMRSASVGSRGSRGSRGGALLLLCLTAASCAGLSGGPGGTGSPGSDPGSTSSACTATDARAPRRLRRLTRFEYDNTVVDLFQIASKWGQGFPPDVVVGAFDNNSDALIVGPLLADKIGQAAEEIAATVSKNMAALSPCAAAAPMSEDCAKQIIATVGRRAFRRKLEDGDTARYLGLYRTVSALDTAAAGIEAVIGAMLQSPHFLYRAELGGAPDAGASSVALTDGELASELSYLIWESMPDDALFAKADARALHTPEQLAAEATRMLASPKSRAMLDHFATSWLALDHVLEVPKDPASYPELPAGLRAAMLAESLDDFDHVIHGGGGRFADLFVTTESIVSDALASFYGLPGKPLEVVRAGVGRWDVSAAHRGGLLSHASVLASQAKPDSTSPVLRGKLVRERLLCQDLPPPPSGVNLQLPPVDPTQSNRARFTAHSTNPACAGCHHLMDPIGFGFERYDGIGRYKDTAAGVSVDDSGEIQSSLHSDGAFHGVLDLESRLAASTDASDCFARQWVRFGYGAADGPATECVLGQAISAWKGSSFKIADLIVALSQAPEFRTRRTDDSRGPGTTPPDLGMGGGALDAGAPPPAPDMSMSPLTVAVMEQSRWASGYCDQATVTNTGPASMEWSVVLSVSGTISNSWNATPVKIGGGSDVSWTGVSFNHTLAAGASVSFGWCAAN